jgi:hypothetical protein
MLVPKPDLHAAIGHAEDLLRREGSPASQDHEEQTQADANSTPPQSGFTEVTLCQQRHCSYRQKLLVVVHVARCR